MWLFISTALAKDIVIQPNGTNDSLRLAIKEAESGDRIVLQKGNYEECVTNEGKDIILYGEKDAQIVGNGSCDSLFSLYSGEVWIQNLRFQSKKNCVRVENRGSVLRIEDAQFVSCGNTKVMGGALYVEFGNVKVINSRFSKNAGEKGGAIHAKSAGVEISGSILSDNMAQIGGGIYSVQSDVTVNDTRIFGNKTKSGGFGAGIAIRNRTHLKMNDVKMQNNHAQGKGGALYADTTSSSRMNNITITESEFTDNSASFGSSTGGAIYIRGLSKSSIISSSFSNNIAANSGGAIALHDIEHQILFEDCKFSKNRARGGNGGAIMIEAATAEKAGTLVVKKSQFTENRAETYGGALSIGNSVNPLGSAQIEYSVFKKNLANSSQSGAGGAIYHFSSAPFYLRVHNSQFHENKAELSGGAIYAYHPQQMDVIESTFFHNQAMGASTAQPRYGGGVMVDGATVFTIERSNFCHNIASSSGTERVSGTGGAVYLQKEERGLVQNSWFWENEAQKNGGGIAAEEANLKMELLIFAGNRANNGAAVSGKEGTMESKNSVFSYSQAGVAVFGEGEFSENQWYSNADGHIKGGEGLKEQKPSFNKIVIDGRCDDDLQSR